MTFLLWLLACTPDVEWDVPDPRPPSPDPTTPDIDYIDELEDAVRVWPEDPGEREFGWALAAGSDLDHDGHLEWAVGAPVHDGWSPNWDPKGAMVRVLQHTDVVAERPPDPGVVSPLHHGVSLAAGDDVNGDGWPDLLYARGGYTEGPTIGIAFDTERSNDADLGPVEDSTGRTVGTMMFTGAHAHRFLLFSMGGTMRSIPLAELPTSGALPLDTDRGMLPSEDVSEGSRIGEWSVSQTDAGIDQEFAIGFSCLSGPGEPCDAPVGIFICDAASTDTTPIDCTPLGDTRSTEVGYWVTAGDLDGDGVDEVVSAQNAAFQTDGLVEVYRADGSLQARIEGSYGDMFGSNPTIVTDGHGDPWLLIGQNGTSGANAGTVWAFRGEDVVGDLIDGDAAKRFVAPTGGRFGHAIVPYQETPDHPLYLLMSAGNGVVYMVPFDDP